jgi:hypothetical protein
MYAQTWLPPFSPIEGHLWLLRHVPAGHDAKTAEADAPWRRYTTLRLDIEDTFAVLVWIGGLSCGSETRRQRRYSAGLSWWAL